MNEKHIVLRGITKSFNHIPVIKNIDIDLAPGRIYALLGKNGAGKTTIVKILAGVYQADSGFIFYDNKKVEIRSPRDARQLKWGFVLQDLGLFDNLSIAENIFFNNFPDEKAGIVNNKNIIAKAKKLCETIGFSIDVTVHVGKLGMGQKHIVAFLRLLAQEPEVLIIDELLSALTREDSEKIFEIIKAMKEKGCLVLFITHTLADIFHHVDNVIVLRDGEVVIDDKIENVADNELLSSMAGREHRKRYPKLVAAPGNEILRTEHVGMPGLLYDISFVLRRGEVLGITGLVGSGRTVLAKLLSGMLPNYSGDLYYNRKKIKLKSTKFAVKQGICMIPDDRVREGIFNVSDLRLNTTIAHMNAIERPHLNFLVDRGLEKKIVTEYLERLGVSYFSLDQQMRFLSSGNQQKVLIARWLLANASVLILDEPTKDLDIASKVEVYNLINEMVRQNKAVIMISSDFTEIIGMSDRVLVLAGGRIVLEMDRDDITNEMIMKNALK